MIYPERHRLLPQKYIKFDYFIYLYKSSAYHRISCQFSSESKTDEDFVMSKGMYHYTSTSCEQETNAMHMAMALANNNVLFIIVVFLIVFIGFIAVYLR